MSTETATKVCMEGNRRKDLRRRKMDAKICDGGKWTQKSATEENGRKDLYEGKWTQRSATAENGRKSLHGGISDGLRIGGKDGPAGQVPAF